MYSINWSNGYLRLDHDWSFSGNWITFTLVNAEYDRDYVTNDYTLSVGIIGLHATLVWR
jgi:hypothetical protein